MPADFTKLDADLAKLDKDIRAHEASEGTSTQPPPPLGPSLSIGTASGMAGGNVSLNVTFTTGTIGVAGIQFDVTLNSALSTGPVTGGQILSAAGKSISSAQIGSIWRFIIFGLNQNTIGSGLLETITFQVAPGTPAGPISVPISSVIFSDPAANSIPAAPSTGGTILI